MKNKQNKAKNDAIFVSHSSEDKIAYVNDLVKEMKALNIKVFYDTDVISWGDNLKEKIDNGLKHCKFAVIVISPNYFGKEWTEYELKTLLERQNKENRKLILPILYNISKEDFVTRYPSLKYIVFKYAKSQSKKNLAIDLKKLLNKN